MRSNNLNMVQHHGGGVLAGVFLVTLSMALGACDALRDVLQPPPPDLHYRVRLTSEGARIQVEVRSGPQSTAWVSFGSSSAAPPGAIRRVRDVAASASNGSALRVRSVGAAAYAIDHGDADPWTLEYTLDLDPLPAEVYQRASSRSPGHLLLVGADAFANFYGARDALDAAPAERPPGAVGEVIVGFDRSSLPEGWTVVTAAPILDADRYRLDDHPNLSVFAVGPYRVQRLLDDADLSVAIHPEWGVARRQVVNTASQLARVLSAELGPPPGGAALLLFTPLPRGVQTRPGVRTAGMAWNRTLVLFGGTEGVPPTNRTVRDMLAIFVGHELFHLYVPWGVSVTDQPSWLSEGWAMHMSRRAAVKTRLLTRSAAEAGLREAYRNYNEMGGFRAGNLFDASEGGEEIRDLLYLRGELVFRIMSLQWEEAGQPGSFDAALWRRLQHAHNGSNPLEPDEVLSVLSSLVSPATVRRFVEGNAMITLPDLGL